MIYFIYLFGLVKIIFEILKFSLIDMSCGAEPLSNDDLELLLNEYGDKLVLQMDQIREKNRLPEEKIQVSIWTCWDYFTKIIGFFEDQLEDEVKRKQTLDYAYEKSLEVFNAIIFGVQKIHKVCFIRFYKSTAPAEPHPWHQIHREINSKILPFDFNFFIYHIL